MFITKSMAEPPGAPEANKVPMPTPSAVPPTPKRTLKREENAVK